MFSIKTGSKKLLKSTVLILILGVLGILPRTVSAEVYLVSDTAPIYKAIDHGEDIHFPSDTSVIESPSKNSPVIGTEKRSCANLTGDTEYGRTYYLEYSKDWMMKFNPSASLGLGPRVKGFIPKDYFGSYKDLIKNVSRQKNPNKYCAFVLLEHYTSKNNENFTKTFGYFRYLIKNFGDEKFHWGYEASSDVNSAVWEQIKTSFIDSDESETQTNKLITEMDKLRKVVGDEEIKAKILFGKARFLKKTGRINEAIKTAFKVNEKFELRDSVSSYYSPSEVLTKKDLRHFINKSLKTGAEKDHLSEDDIRKYRKKIKQKLSSETNSG